MKKIIVLVLALFLMSSLLTACRFGSNDTTPPTTTTQTPTTTSTVPVTTTTVPTTLPTTTTPSGTGATDGTGNGMMEDIIDGITGSTQSGAAKNGRGMS